MHAPSRFTLAVSVLVLNVLLSLQACGPSPEDARRALIERGIEVTDERFIQSAASGDAEAVELFLRAGHNPNVGDDRRNPLRAAVESGSTRAVKLLLDAGADPNREGLLELATARGNQEIVDLLLASSGGALSDQGGAGGGEAVMTEEPFFGDEAGVVSEPITLSDAELRAFQLAARQGDVALIQTFLDRGADPDQPIPVTTRDRQGNSLSYYSRANLEPVEYVIQDAVLSGNRAAVQLLLDAGATARGVPYAILSRRPDLLNLILEERPASALEAILHGETICTPLALLFADTDHHYPCRVQAITNRSTDQNISADAEVIPMARMLYAMGSPVNSEQLRAAVKRRSIEQVRLVLSQGHVYVDDPSTGYHVSILMHAVEHGGPRRVELVRALVEAGASPDTYSQTTYGSMTPRQYVERYGDRLGGDANALRALFDSVS